MQTSKDGSSETQYDALGRRASIISMLPTMGTTNRIDCMEYDMSENVVSTTTDFLDGRVAVSTTEYDSLNRNILATDSLGLVKTTEHDALGRTVFTGGDAYPLCFDYDTAGRKTVMKTTRDGGATWDVTRWEYDPVCGVNTVKVYADGSRITYDYTDNGRKTRTTWARGAWKHNSYNERNLVSGTTYSDATPSVAYAYADSGKVASATLSDGTSYAYGYDDHLLCTNETAALGDGTFVVARTYDDRWRSLNTSVMVTNVPHAASTRHYDTEDRIRGYAFTNAVGRGISVAFAYSGSYLTNTVYTLPNGNCFTVNLTREMARRELVTQRAYFFNASPLYSYTTGYDLIGRPTNAVDSLTSVREWLYNRRSELVAAQIGTNSYGYAYDTIGNRTLSSVNATTNAYAANNLNQYTQVGRDAPIAPPVAFSYDADGNMTNDGRFTYTFGAENRLASAYPITPAENALAVENAYDHQHRRIRKTAKRYNGTEWQLAETHDFAYDGNNIVLERITFADGTTRTCEYFWGNDLSGTEQGAGGVGGLVAVSVDGSFYIPCYNHNGNIVCYVSEFGAMAAQYVYDPYGNILEQYGTLADAFSIRFSTKYVDSETGLISYLRRYYQPEHGRWLNRDPIEEDGGENLYAMIHNSISFEIDALGLSTYNIFDLVHDQLCEDVYREIGSYLDTAQELAAWDRYTNHGGLVSNRDIELSSDVVKSISESVNGVVGYVDAKRSSCKKGINFIFSTSIGGNAPNPWIKALGGVSIRVSTECSNGCFSYSYRIHDLYDFDIKGVPGFTSRSAKGETQTIVVRMAGVCLQCNWQTFYHKGEYYGK